MKIITFSFAKDAVRLWDVVEYLRQFEGEEGEEMMASLPVSMERLLYYSMECYVSYSVGLSYY